MVQNIFLEKMDFKHFKQIISCIVTTWKSIAFSDESIRPPATSDDILTPRLDDFNNTKFRVEFNGSC